MELIKVEYLIPSTDREIHDTAHAILLQTMAAGASTNGVASYWNKPALEYHAQKAMLHVVNLFTAKDLEAREKDEPKLRHLFNAVTRLVIAEAVRIKKAQTERIEPLQESADE